MIRIGIIGCGRILAAHLRGYRLLREAGFDGFRITALCARQRNDALAVLRPDPNYPLRAPVGTRPGDPLAVGGEYLSRFQPDTEVTIHADWQSLAADPQVDAINDFTLHTLHHPIALAAAKHQKDLLTQKPLAATVSEAQEMVAQFAQRNLVLGVCENWRYRPLTRYVKWAIDEGKIGALQMLFFLNVGNWWAPRQVVAHTPWRHLRASGGGITLDIGPHLFHWVRHLAGEISSVQAQTHCFEPRRSLPAEQEGAPQKWVECDADDTFSAHFSTESGAAGALTASWAGGSGLLLGQGPQIIGSEGRIDGDQIITNDGAPQSVRELYERDCDATRQNLEFPLQLTDDFALLQHDWLQAVRQRTPSEVTGLEGLRDLACAEAVLQSDREGCRVKPEPPQATTN